MSKTQATHDPLTEAAWYALSPFLNPLDCSRRQVWNDENGDEIKAAIPLNSNDTLNGLYNGDVIDGGVVKPSWFSKKRLANHLMGRETYYYRSRPNGFWRDGYGSSDKAKDRLGTVADLLSIQGKCRKYPYVGVMLLCADIDCHNGEKDVEKVRDWLLDRYFPGAYWEPSTGGDGVHLYVKLAYRPWLLGQRDRTLRYVVDTIEELSCLLDRERRALGYDAPVDRLRGLPSLLVEKNDRVRIQRSLCIKIPRFKNGLEDVRAFHAAPFFLFDGLANLLRTRLNQPVRSDDKPDGLVADALGWEIGIGSDYRPRNRCGSSLSLNSVYPSYTEQVEEVRQQQDAFTRTIQFVLAYSRHIRRVPTVDDALAEYEAKVADGAATTGQRRSRLAYVLKHVAKTFKPSIDLHGGFQAAHNELLAEIRSLMPSGTDLTYTKARGRRVAVTDSDIAAVLHAMRRSQGHSSQTEFSQERVREAVRIIRGRACCKNMASTLTKALKAMGLIERVGGYIPGKRGTVYRVKSCRAQVQTAAEPSSPFMSM
jgi:hypothetical protein